MKQIFFYFIALFLPFVQIYSQSATKADTLFWEGDYKNAYILYHEILSATPNPPKEIISNTAQCAYFLKKYDQTINLLESLENEESEKNILLGKAYFENYFFEKATIWFTNFLSKKDTIDTEYKYAEKKLKQAKLGQKLIKRVENIVFIDSVVVPKNEAIKKIILSKEIGKFTQREELLNGKPIELISFTTERGNKIYNSIVYNHNTDIRLEETLLNNNVETKRITELNTSYNENYPFLTLDGVTLYFCSNNSKSMGGYDIFITQLNHSDNHYLKPENIGMPFNSPFNDYLLAIDEVNKIGWLVSDRYQEKGYVTIYRFVPNDEKIIVKTENLDSLRRRAKISTFNKMAYKPPHYKKVKVKNKPLILIKDNLYYEKASDFRSQEAKNYYYQSKKKQKLILEAKKSLKKLRKEYHSFKKEEDKEKVANQIIKLEKYLLKQIPIQKELEKKMRNLEIKQLKNL